MIAKSNKLQVHYYFFDDSHSIDAVVRNECEKELLNIYSEIATSLHFKLAIESEPPEEGGFSEFWKFLGDNYIQITLLVSVAALIISRKPVENKRLTKAQIENLELDSELKRRELQELKLKSLKESDIDGALISRVVDLLMLNYKIVWRRSNFYKKLSRYNKITKFSAQRFLDDKAVGSSREVHKRSFTNFVLYSDNLPEIEIEGAVIDLISPVLKSGNFLWKGFYQSQIISFEMHDNSFKGMVQHGEIKFTNNASISTIMKQSRKIDENGLIKVAKTKVLLVIEYKVDGTTYLTEQGRDYRNNKS